VLRGAAHCRPRVGRPEETATPNPSPPNPGRFPCTTWSARAAPGTTPCALNHQSLPGRDEQDSSMFPPQSMASRVQASGVGRKSPEQSRTGFSAGTGWTGQLVPASCEANGPSSQTGGSERKILPTCLKHLIGWPLKNHGTERSLIDMRGRTVVPQSRGPYLRIRFSGPVD
jgi:hypothetical protein